MLQGLHSSTTDESRLDDIFLSEIDAVLKKEQL